MQALTPFNAMIPRGSIKENMLWRRKVILDVIKNPENAAYFKAACSKDILFFVNTFVWTFDPRLEGDKYVPMVLYEFQEDGIVDLLDAIANHDMLIEKSRDMGASWICIAVFAWCWLFVPGFSGLFVSRVEDLVDKSGNPKSLFWKLDCLLSHLPSWLLPEGYDENLHRSKMHIENPENASVIDGESTTHNVARGDRRTAILLDEFAAVVEHGYAVLASTRDATKCRIFNSTPCGINNAFYAVRQTSIKKLRLHWSAHPLKRIGLYTTNHDGTVKFLDNHKFPSDYKFILDSKLRSIWYDGECERAANPQEIAQELDIDYLGSGFQFFNPNAISTAIASISRPPFIIGDLDYDDMTGEFTEFRENINGHLRLWCLLDAKGLPSISEKIVVGGDISAGTGASNSCLEGYNIVTYEKVFEYVNPYVRPEQFAKQAFAICKWFNNAYLAWEQHGPGRQFGAKLLELGYGNIYLQKRTEALSQKVTDIPGWVPSKESKLQVVGSYRDAVEKCICINRSKEALQETLEYIYAPDGSVEHARATNKVDPSGANANHGDRVIGDSLAWMLIKERMQEPVKEEREIPIGSLAWRMKQRELEQRKKSRNGW